MRPLEIMRMAAELGLQCPPTTTELSVGCVIVNAQNEIVTTGYSREDGDQKTHAEQAAIDKLAPGTDTSDMTLYASVEPCGTRLSARTPCAHLIIARRFKEVCYGMHEPPHFVNQNGLGQMRTQGIKITHVCDEEISALVARANPHVRWNP